MNKAKKKTLVWLDLYGLLRAHGKTPNEAMDVILDADQDRAEAFAAIAELTDTMIEADRQRVAGMITGVGGAASALASAIPVVGTLVSAALAAGTALTAWFADAVRREYDLSCSLGCNPTRTTWEREALMPFDQPSGRLLGGMPYYTNAKFWHDGLVVEGPGGGMNASGKVVGAAPRTRSYETTVAQCTNARVGDREVRLNPDGKLGRSGFNKVVPWRPNLPGGNWQKPWNDPPGGTIASRAWRVMWVCRWAEKQLPCDHLMCATAVLNDLRLKDYPPGEDSYTLRRRTGSRWYASVYYMLKDFWDVCARMGADRAPAYLRLNGAPKTAECIEYALTGGAYDKQDSPYPWIQPLRFMDWNTLRKLLRKLYPSTRIASVGKAPPKAMTAAPTGMTKTTHARLKSVVQKLRAPGAVGGQPGTERGQPDTEGGLPGWVVPLGAAVGGVGLVWLLTKKD